MIRLRDVWKSYGDLVVLKGIDLEVREGEFLGILGKSGSGKSTLLRIMGLMDKPTKGEVYVQGKPTSHLNDDELSRLRAQTIGFVFQFFNLIPSLTALENVMLPMEIVGEPDEERAKELLRLVGLAHRIDHLPSQMSGGEQQRVAIARALANNPKFILADEPTGNLDEKTTLKIMDLFKKLHEEEGLTIVMVTHDKDLEDYCTRVIYIQEGKVIS